MNITSKFVLKNQINKDGTQAVLFRVTYERKPFYLNTGIKVHPNFFNEKGFIIKSHPYHDVFNVRLKSIEQKLNKLIASYVSKEETTVITFDDLKQHFLRKPLPPVLENFADYCLRILESEVKKTLTPSTIKNHKLHIKQVQEYAPNLTFNQIDRQWLSDYEFYCRYDLKNSINTVQSKLKNIRTYINKAIRDGIITDYVFRTFHLKTEPTKPKFLSMDEFRALELYYIETTSTLHKKHLQYFLFACVTGLRFSDVKALKWSCIRNNWIMFKTEKTKQHVSIPINDHVRKYLPDQRSLDGSVAEALEATYSKNTKNFLGIFVSNLNTSLVTGCVNESTRA